MITPSENETFHPNDGNPYWNESAWFSFVIPEHEINQVLERGKDGRPLRLTLSATDKSGRSLNVEGTGVAWLRFPGLTFIAYWWVMVKWRYAGLDIYGEVQDGWPMQEFRRHIRASK